MNDGMNESKRDFVKGMASLGAVPFLLEGSEAATVMERKPLTQAGIVRSLLSLADRADKDGFKIEAKAIMELAGRLLREVK